MPRPSHIGHLIPAASRAQATLDPSTYLEWDLENLPPGNDYAPTPRHYNTSGGPKEAMLNIHFISHSHVRYACVLLTFSEWFIETESSLKRLLCDPMQDDVGWLKTIDEYYSMC